ncbi:MAG: bL9 family ribosomal protein [Solirubrobacterales bacterium]
MAQAVLLADVENLGAAGEAIDVSPGYLRNYLVPASSPSRQPQLRWRRPSAARSAPPRPSARRPSGPARPLPCSPRPC